MKRYPLNIIAFLIVGISSYGQITNNSSFSDSAILKPIARIVNNFIQKKIPFTPISILSEVDKSERLQDFRSVVSSYTAARINLDSLEKLVQNKSQAISFSFPFDSEFIKEKVIFDRKCSRKLKRQS